MGTRKTDAEHQQHVDCFNLKVALGTSVPRYASCRLASAEISMAPHPCRPTEDLLLFHAKVGAAVLHQRARLAEAARIKQHLQPLPRRQLALRWAMPKDIAAFKTAVEVPAEMSAHRVEGGTIKPAGALIIGQKRNAGAEPPKHGKWMWKCA